MSDIYKTEYITLICGVLFYGFRPLYDLMFNHNKSFIYNDLQQQTKVAKSEKTFLESTFS